MQIPVCIYRIYNICIYGICRMYSIPYLYMYIYTVNAQSSALKSVTPGLTRHDGAPSPGHAGSHQPADLGGDAGRARGCRAGRWRRHARHARGLVPVDVGHLHA